jgi:hypothetical protein
MKYAITRWRYWEGGNWWTAGDIKNTLKYKFCVKCTRVYPKVSGLAAWSENCKWYSTLPPDADVSLFVSQSSEFCRHNPLCSFSMVFVVVVVYFVIDSVRKLLDIPSYQPPLHCSWHHTSGRSGSLRGFLFLFSAFVGFGNPTPPNLTPTTVISPVGTPTYQARPSGWRMEGTLLLVW